MSLIEFRSQFSLSSLTHLNNAGITPLSKPAYEAIDREARLAMEEGFFGLENTMRSYEAARTSMSRLLNIEASQIAFTQTCAASISQVALGFPLKAHDEILLWDQEYPSNAYPWHAAAKRANAKVNILPSGTNLSLDTEKFINAITPKTKLAVCSWVQYQSGEMTDLKSLSLACHEVGAWLCVDGFQGIGVIPFDMKAMGVDALCGGGHKWLCGPLGVGYLALATKEHIATLQPIVHGAVTYGHFYDPVNPSLPPRKENIRFEPGSPNVLSAAAIGASADLFMRIGISNIHAQSIKLAEQLIAGLEDIGITPLCRSRNKSRSPIVTFKVPSGSPIELMEKAKKENISINALPIGIRVSPHGFNTEEEITKLVGFLKKTFH